MIIVSDTTPLITLMKLKQLELLKKMFKKIIIPQAVYDELTVNPLYKNEAEFIQETSYIKVVRVQELEAVEKVMEENKLDIGESEAIVLYKEKSAKLLLMDERKGRRVAMSKKCNVMGTTGIIVNSVYEGYMSKEECIKCHAILSESNIRIKDSLLSALEDAIQGKFSRVIISKSKLFKDKK